MEESTNIPIPIAKPPSDMMFSVTSRILSGANVTKIEMGILSAMMAVVRRSRRKISSTRMASMPPKYAVLITSEILLSIKMDRSATTRR